MRNLIVITIALLITVAHSNAVPSLMTYQGRLTDPGGNPVPDGNYSVTFRIYDAPIAGTTLYTSAPTIVATNDGLFSCYLGGITHPIFAGSVCYMGITVGADPEISPRTRLNTEPYAFRVASVDSAGAGTLIGDLQLNDLSGKYLSTSQGNRSLSTYFASGIEATRIWGPTYGEFLAYDSISGVPRAQLGAGANNYPYLNLAANGQNIILLAADTGDNTVRLPDNAINSREMLNEPGIASAIMASNNVIVPAGGTFSDMVTVTITTPAPGYIEVEGRGYSTIFGVSGGQNLGFVQIDETPGGGLVGYQFTHFGFGTTPNGISIVFPVYVKTTYFKPAGTYTFRIEAAQHPSNTPPASQFFSYGVITARYMPTSYGPVAGVVAQDGSHDFEGSAGGVPGTIQTHTRTLDLRDLELQLAKEEAAVEKTRRLLIEEKLTQYQTTKEIK